MANQVTLTASMRSNLLSLQNTQRLFDMTQERLSTGKKVNSALDNPSSYFAAQSLNSRANQLETLMDGMGQATQTLKATDAALTTLNTYAEQAKALVNNALDTRNTETYKVGGVNVKMSTGLDSLGGIALNDSFVIRKGQADTMETNKTYTGTQDISSTLANGFSLRLVDNKGNYQEAKISGSKTVDAMLQDIREGFGRDATGNYKVDASLVDGKITLVSNDKTKSLIALEDGTNTDAADLGFDTGYAVKIDLSGTAKDFKYEKLIKATTGDLALTTKAQVSGDFAINLGGVDHKVAVSATDTVSDLIKNINSQLGDTVTAEWDGANKAIRLTAIDPNIEVTTAADVTMFNPDGVSDDAGLDAGAAPASAAEGLPTTMNVYDLMQAVNGMDGVEASLTKDGKLQIRALTGEDLIITDLGTGKAASALGISGVSDNGNTVRKDYSEQFNEIMNQIDKLVTNGDTGYKGVNLLNGDSLTVNFNENRTSQLNITGVKFDTNGLGLKTAKNEWTTTADIEDSLAQIDKAINNIKSVSSAFAQNLAIVQTREDFTDNMIDTLVAGADKLVLADMNEEAANMLALQTRQQLGTNALSLANQAQQGVLRLF